MPCYDFETIDGKVFSADLSGAEFEISKLHQLAFEEKAKTNSKQDGYTKRQLRRKLENVIDRMFKDGLLEKIGEQDGETIYEQPSGNSRFAVPEDYSGSQRYFFDRRNQYYGHLRNAIKESGMDSITKSGLIGYFNQVTEKLMADTNDNIAIIRPLPGTGMPIEYYMCKRQIAATKIVFSGPGFYVTDNKPPASSKK